MNASLSSTSHNVAANGAEKKTLEKTGDGVWLGPRPGGRQHGGAGVRRDHPQQYDQTKPYLQPHSTLTSSQPVNIQGSHSLMTSPQADLAAALAKAPTTLEK